MKRIVTTKFRFECDLRFWSHLMKNAAPFALAMLFGLVYFKIDVVLLSLLKGDAFVGWYSAGYRVMEGLIFIAGAFVNTVFPVLSRHYVLSEDVLIESVEKSFRFLLSLGLPISLGLLVVADKIVTVFYGQEYVNAIIVLRIIAFALLFVFMNYLFGVILGAMNKQHLHFLATVIGVVVNIALNLALIPAFGHVGASIASTATQGALFCVYGYMVLKNLTVPINVKFISKIVASGALMGLIVFLVRGPLWLSVGIGCVIYPVFLLVFRTFSMDDLRLVMRVLNLSPSHPS
jgi:O-antigen/teichoic acid export membrane protein